MHRGDASPSTGKRPAATSSAAPEESKGRGIPEGTRLQAYYGECTITEPDTIVDSALVDCERLVVAAERVHIMKSRLPAVDVDGPGRSVLIEDSEINGGASSWPAIGYANITVRRSVISGGQHSVLCGTNCVVEDSWLHSQTSPESEARHNNAFLSNGGSNVVLRGNTFACTPSDNSRGGGCSADVSLFGDFSAVSNVTIEGNVFKSSPGAFCARLGHDPQKRFGSRTTKIVFRDNVFERGEHAHCGTMGAVTSVPRGTTWAENRYDDGQPVPSPSGNL